MSEPIVIVEYDPEWPHEFARLHRRGPWQDQVVAGRADRFKENEPRLIATFGDDRETLRRAWRVLELMEKAWRDSYGENSTPSDKIVDDVLLCSGGTLPGLIDAAHLAIVDWRDVVVWASDVRTKVRTTTE